MLVSLIAEKGREGRISDECGPAQVFFLTHAMPRAMCALAKAPVGIVIRHGVPTS